MGELIAAGRHAWPPEKIAGINERLLDETSEAQAFLRGLELSEMGFDTHTVAISNGYARTAETARLMGGVIINKYSQLNEVPVPEEAYNEVVRELIKGKMPHPDGYGLYQAGLELFRNMPPESVWNSHASRLGPFLHIVYREMGIQPPTLLFPYLGYAIIDRDLSIAPKLHFDTVEVH